MTREIFPEGQVIFKDKPYTSEFFTLAMDEIDKFRDLDSTNGSIVNGKAVKETELSNGDIVQMGNTTLKIHFVSS